MIRDQLDVVQHQLGDRIGGVLYSGMDAFSRPSRVYLLGLNPGDNRSDREIATVSEQIDASLQRKGPWSAYVDEAWNSPSPGGSPMQVRVQHLLRSAGLDPRAVPASNVVFVRSDDAAGIAQEKQELLEQCWPFHLAVIERLGIAVVACMGEHASRWVRERLKAERLVENHAESNDRGWKSHLHATADGRFVLSLTHPSRVDWTSSNSDPSHLLVAALVSAPEKSAYQG